MIAVREIDHLVLRVSDAETMLAFYRDVLDCTLERRQDEIGLIQLRAGRSLIDLVPVDGALGRAGGAAPGPEGRNLDHFCLRVEPFDEADIRRRLARHGIDAGPLALRYGAEGEGPSLYLSDPEGNVVELKGPAASAPIGASSTPEAAVGRVSAAEVKANARSKRSPAFGQFCQRCNVSGLIRALTSANGTPVTMTPRTTSSPT